MSLTDAARYRLAALGLGAVLLLLGGFVIVSATITRSGADRLERETTVAWAFERARSAVALQEAHVAQAAANGDQRWLRDRIGEDADRLSGALDDVRRVGESLDRDAAERIAVEEERYVEAVAAGAAADPEPLRELTAATADERSTLLEHVGGFRRSGDTVFVVTILAFALGYALLSVFGGIMRRIQQRRQRAERDRREALEGMATVAEVSRQIGAGSDARADVCAAACRVGRADFAMLLEPRDAATLACSAASGVEATGLVIDAGSGRSAAHDTLRSGETRFVARCAGDPTLNPPLMGALGPASLLFASVQGATRTVGVLVVGWHRPIAGLSPAADAGLRSLAQEAAAAIDRADLVAQLRSLVRVDELTGLMSARAYEEELPRELARARRDGRPVAVVALRPAVADDPAQVKATSAGLRQSLRLTDDLARREDGTYLAILPACDACDAQIVVDRMLAGTPPGAIAAASSAAWDGAEDAAALTARTLLGLAAPSAGSVR